MRSDRWNPVLAMVFGGLVWVAQRPVPACAAADQPRTFVLKRVGTLDIRCDVYRPDDMVKRPVVVWIHGGALIVGHRGWIDGRLRKDLLEAGYVIVSIDYRLAPETPLPEIVRDVEDAWTWIHEQGPRLFQAEPSRMAVMGGSAGGYLTLTTGFRVSPRPTALVSLFGYGDLVGAWYSQPSPHACHQRIKVSQAEAFQQVSGPPISDARDRPGDGGVFYQYCRQHGAWPKAVSGWDPQREIDKFAPFMPVRNVTADYPPTLLIHGTDDTDVPYEQSVMMAQQFVKYGVEHQLITIPHAEHGLAGGAPELVDQAYRQVIEFVNRHMAD